MQFREKYSYSKYRDKKHHSNRKSKVFVAPKQNYSLNPIIYYSANFWLNILLVLIIIASWWVLFYSSFFKISEIIVEGNNLVSSEDIIKNLDAHGNIFRFNISDSKKKIISSFPIIEDVAIYRGIPNALKIVVLEKKPVMVWQSAGKYYLIDEIGTVDKETTSGEYMELVRVSDQKNVAVKIGDQIVSPQFIDFVYKINENFFQKTNIKITGFQIHETTFDLFASTEAGFFVKFDISRSYEKQLEDLKNILVNYRQDIHEYVDVRINGWVYYK